jgi:hypothetical protein
MNGDDITELGWREWASVIVIGIAAAIVGWGEPRMPPSDDKDRSKEDLAPEFTRLVRMLKDRTQKQDWHTFPRDPDAASQPGLYSWWADNEARSLIGSVLGVEVPSLIYVGQAGAGDSTATLSSRILDRHFGGDASFSTLRRTLTSVLRKPLHLDLEAPGKLTAESNARVSTWMRAHLQVVIAPFGNRDLLERVERRAIGALDPPLNLKHVKLTKSRLLLKKLRSELGDGAN